MCREEEDKPLLLKLRMGQTTSHCQIDGDQKQLLLHILAIKPSSSVHGDIEKQHA